MCLSPAPDGRILFAASLGALARLGRRTPDATSILVTASRESRGMRGNRDTENPIPHDWPLPRQP